MDPLEDPKRFLHRERRLEEELKGRYQICDSEGHEYIDDRCISCYRRPPIPQEIPPEVRESLKLLSESSLRIVLVEALERERIINQNFQDTQDYFKGIGMLRRET